MDTEGSERFVELYVTNAESPQGEKGEVAYWGRSVVLVAGGGAGRRWHRLGEGGDQWHQKGGGDGVGKSGRVEKI